MSDYSNLYQMFGGNCTDGNTSQNLGFGSGKIIIWIILIFLFSRWGRGGDNYGCGGSNWGSGGNNWGSGGNNCCCDPCCCYNSCDCSCSCCEPCQCKCKEYCCCCGGVRKGNKKQKSYIVETASCNPCCNQNQCNNNTGGFGNSGFGGGCNICQIMLIIAIFLIRRTPTQVCKPC